MKKVAINQSNYIPWKGYFDMIAAVDEFIIYDDMQYTRRDWRNRNQIKSPDGLIWLTVPVKVKGKYDQKIRETEINGTDWSEKHWKTVLNNYRKTPHFDEVSTLLEPFYREAMFTHLSQLNRSLIAVICGYLGISTRITSSSEYTLVEGKTERLVDLCVKAGGTEYISGPAAKVYVDETLFTERNLKVSWFSYEGYPVYDQLWGEFSHQVSIIDLLFNCGKYSPRYMRHVLK